jgi:hypothetical protein
VSCALFIALQGALPSYAHAQASTGIPRQEDDSDGGERPYRRFYGGSLIASYAVPLSVTWLALGGLRIPDDDHSWKNDPRVGLLLFVAELSELTTLVAPPIVHWAHDDVGRGFAVFGGNLGLSLLGFAAGASACDRNVEGGCSVNVERVLLGIAVAQTLGGFIDVFDYYANRPRVRRILREEEKEARWKPSVTADIRRHGSDGIELRLRTDF